MTAAPARSRAETWAPWIAGALLALPVLVATYPPMIDLPFHEASIAVLRYFHDASRFPPGLYQLNLGHPNQMFHVLAWALSYLVSTQTACKIVVAATVASLPITCARLADHLGATRWAALVVSPFALGFFFFMGLVANLIGLTLIVALTPALDRFVDAPTARRAGWICLACVALYFAHASTLLLYAGMLALFAFGQPLRARETALRFVPVAFSAAVMVAQLTFQRHLLTAAAKVGVPIDVSAWEKILALPNALCSPDTPLYRGPFVLVVLAIALLLALRVRQADGAARVRAVGLAPIVHRWRYELFIACCLVAYFAFPSTLNGATLVYTRFLTPAFIFGGIVASPRSHPAPPAVPRLLPLLAFTCPLSLLLTVWPAFADQSRSFADLETLLPRIELGSGVAVLAEEINDPSYGIGRTPLANRAMAERGGRVLYSLSESPISPIVVNPAYQWDDAVERVLATELNFCPRFDLTRFRYVILHSNTAKLARLMVRALAPDARVLAAAGEWTLFESTLPTVPLKSPEMKAPRPCPGFALKQRLDHAVDELNAELRAKQQQGTPAP